MSNHRSATILDIMANAVHEWKILLAEGSYTELSDRLDTAEKDLRVLIKKDERNKTKKENDLGISTSP